MAEGTITLGGIQKKPDIPTFTESTRRIPTPVTPAKAPVKKNNVVTIAVYLDGAEHYLSFSVPLSSSLMSGQKTKESLSRMFEEILSQRFGRVTKL